MVCTALSAGPLLCGKFGLLVSYVKSQNFVNCWNSSLVTCLALSVTRIGYAMDGKLLFQLLDD